MLILALSGFACGRAIEANDASLQQWGPVFGISLIGGMWLYIWWCRLSADRTVPGVTAGLGLNVVVFGLALAATADESWPIYLVVAGVALIG